MALVRSARLSQTFISPGTADTAPSNAFTPSNNSLLTVIVSAQQNGGNIDISTKLTLVDSLGSTWTKRASSGTSGVAFGPGLVCWTTPIVTGASMTLTLGAGTSDSINVYFLTVVDYTGYDTVTPVGTKGESAALPTDGAATLTLNATTAATSEIIGARIADVPGTGTVSATPAAGHTEVYDLSVDDNCGHQMQARDIGSTSTAFSWTDINSGTSAPSANVVGVAIEVNAAAAAAAAETNFYRPPALAPGFRSPNALQRMVRPIRTGDLPVVSAGVAVSFDGHGDIAMGGTADLRATMALAGHGDMAIAATNLLKLAAALAGHGDLATAGTGDLKLAAALAAHGDIAIAGTGAFRVTMALAGHGDLTMAGTAQLLSALALAGHGDMAMAATAALRNALALAGHGDMSTAGQALLIATLRLAGHGDMAMVGTADLSLTGRVDLAGHGDLAMAGVASITVVSGGIVVTVHRLRVGRRRGGVTDRARGIRGPE